MRLLAFALLFTAGCSAVIPDGRIGCHDPESTCPSGFYCWSLDRQCHRMPERDVGVRFDGDVPDSNLPDAAMPPDGAPGMCTRNEDCVAPEVCVPGRWGGGVTAACADASAARPPMHGMACSGDAQCTAPDACLGGACVRPCVMGTGNPMCGGGEDCAPAPPSTGIAGGVCLGGCTAAMPCPSAAYECLGPTPRYTCFPVVWDAGGIPP